MNQVLSSSGVMERADNIPFSKKLLVARRASLLQQADALLSQRRAILAEAGEIEKALKDEENKAG